MRAADAAEIASGTPEDVLMDRAGHACAVVAMRMLGGAYGKRVVVVCGKGNNGGDGLICAAYLRAAGVHATVVRTEDWSRETFHRAARRADLVIDALLGTGTSGPPRGAVAEAIEAIDGSGVPALPIDIPSGVAAADGAAPGPAVSADVTLAMQALKAGHLIPPGAFRCGRIEVADIGIPVGEPDTFVPEASDVAGVLPRRRADAHKYEVGALAILAGSAGMTGAAILAARGASRAGAGLVISGVPQSVLGVIEGAALDSVKVPLPEAEGQLEAKAVDEFADRMSRARALAVGPGLGRGPRAVGVLERVLGLDVPLIIDADGLWALGEILREQPDVLRKRTHPTILTPHAGEFAFLAGRPPAPDRLADVRECAKEWWAVVHLKGPRALTTAPDGMAWINPTGNPGGATGGTGDVLTGMVGALVAQGAEASSAMWSAAYLHGAALDSAAARLGTLSLTATDVADAVPLAVRRLRVAVPPHTTIRTVLEAEPTW
jgi:ADP-dependent NAD(P)H-hydrate dehydratase / NAD(P)H-hydrate epimerase